MAIQGISGMPNSAIFSTLNQSTTSTTTKEDDLVASKLGSLQNSEIGAADLITASLSAVTGKDTSSQMGRYTDLCCSLLSQQAKRTKGLASYYNASGSSVSFTSSTSINLSIDIEFDENDLAAMQDTSSADMTQALTDDGYWGVDAVASRIMDMAVALSGGDTEKIDLLQDAVDKGFENAYSILGGEGNAPDGTKETKDEINKRFDYWRETGSLDGYTMTSDTADEA